MINEIVEIINNNVGEVCGPILSAITDGLIGFALVKGKTRKEELERIKAGQIENILPELLESGVITYQQMYEAKNFKEIAKLADNFYDKNKQHKTNEYDFDWLLRFYDEAKRVSDKEIQELWARILAKEIDTPKTYSYRVIDVIKNLSKEEIDIFVRICENTICDKNRNEYLFPTYITNAVTVGSKDAISYENILLMDEIGLMKSNATILRVSSGKRNEWYIVCNNRIAIIESKEGSFNFNIDNYPFTSVGKELARTLEFTGDKADMLLFGTILKSKIKYDVGVYDIIGYDKENNCQFDSDKNLLLNNSKDIK